MKNNCKVIAIANQKGGVGKTTTTLNLGIGLANQGKKILLIDADSSADLSEWLDKENANITLSNKLFDVISNNSTLTVEGIQSHREGIDILPADKRLADLELTMVSAFDREKAMRKYINEVRKDYDFVLIDCSPSLGLISLNALAAADSVIIPVQAHYMPAKDMTKLLSTISQVKKYINPKLKVDGILLTLVDNRTNLAKSTADSVRENFGARIKIFDSQIPFAIKSAESAAKKKSIFKYAPKSPVAESYNALTKEVLNGAEKEKNRLLSADAR